MFQRTKPCDGADYKQYLYNFERHCKIFYHRSLCVNADRSEETNDADATAKVILQAFDLCLLSSSEIALDIENRRNFLSSPNTKLNCMELISCGLLFRDSNVLLFPEIPSNVLLKYIH